MSHTLVQIGNSKALIIPAKIIKKRNYTTDTEFDIIETNDGLRITHKMPELETLEFPKAKKPIISRKINRLRNIVKFTEDEIEQDDKLKYILSR